MNARLTVSSFVALALATAASAQSLHVVPRSYTATEGPSLTGVVGIGMSDREQILIDPALLTEVVGHDITGIAFRRDGSDPNPYAGVTASVVVAIGTSTRTPHTAAADFAANLSTPLEVFRGGITVPASPAPNGLPSWQGTDVVEINWTTPYRYTGGTLCLDITGTASNASWWAVDAAEDSTAGSAVSEGHACGTYAAVHGETSFVATRDLVVGETVLCSHWGGPGNPAFLLLGVATFGSPIDLGVLRAPGCELRVDSFVALGTTVSAPVVDARFGGIAQRSIHVPADARFAGGEFVTQWCELPTGTITTSNTLRCRIASTLPTLGMAVVWSRAGTEPVVQFTRAPVVGLRYQ